MPSTAFKQRTDLSTLQFVVDKVHTRRKQPMESKDILNRLFDIRKADPQKLNFREIIGAMSINV